MKAKILVLALIAILLFGMDIQAQAASTPTYLGQTTWTMKIIYDTGDPFLVGTSVTLTGGLTKVGDNYYSFQGSIPYSTGTLLVLSGGGALINGKLILTLSDSSVSSTDGDRVAAVMNVNLDTASNNYLNGSFSEVATGCFHNGVNGQSDYGHALFAGTMTLTGKSIPLTLAPTAPLSLLLLP